MSKFRAIALLVPLSIFALPCFVARAQAQPADLDMLHALHETTAHAEPAADSPAAFSVAEGANLIWAVHAEKDGFYRVTRENKGPQGWIASADVEVLHEHVHHEDRAIKACVETLDDCPKRGCAAEESAEAAANEIKRSVPKDGKLFKLSIDDFVRLQREADERVGQGPQDLTPTQHESIKHLPVAGGTVSEGDRVRVVGYIAKGDEGLHANLSGESVNCQLKKLADNDIHIPLVAKADDTEYQGIVVEMIPQQRPQAWTVEALKELQGKGTQVWVEGGLAYDKVHYVNADRANPFKDEPARTSLWEVHPITKFMVCGKEHCDADNAEDWTALGEK